MTDVNDAGQVVGRAGGRAFRWQAGVLTDLGTPAGATSNAVDVNNLGHVLVTVGGSPFLWKDGVLTDLGLPAGVQVAAVNDAGQVIGNPNGRAFLWRDGATTDLGELIPGCGASAADINEAGEVTGSAYSGLAGSLGLPVNHAFLWRDGVMTGLGTPPFTDGSYPAAINNSGQVVGSTSVFINTGYAAAFVSKSFFYDGTKMITLPVPTLQNLATDVNDAGQVVGTMNGRAYLYEGGVVKDLNTLLAPASPVVGSAAAINNAGQIVGHTSAGRAVLLTPDAPAPAGPEVRVWVDGAEMQDAAGTVDFGETTLGAAVTRTVSVRNVGASPLDLAGPVQAPPGFSVSSGFDATTLAPGPRPRSCSGRTRPLRARSAARCRSGRATPTRERSASACPGWCHRRGS